MVTSTESVPAGTGLGSKVAVMPSGRSFADSEMSPGSPVRWMVRVVVSELP